MQQVRTIKVKSLFGRMTDDEHVGFYHTEIVDALEILFTNIPAMITAYEAFKVRLEKEDLIGKWNKKVLNAFGKKQVRIALKTSRQDVDKAFTALLMEVNSVCILGEAVESDPDTQSAIYEIIGAINASLSQLEYDLVRRRSKATEKNKPPQVHIFNPTMPDLYNILNS